ncbi:MULTISPECIES: PAS and ANTAR domain-containing protein [Nocardioides]|uniref:PAS and ANTAR domain-containing protein n=1 Tax=Nocardioides vastitatis TaxID=2568655 RepID=A0ABW0ZIQ7_9ACTN|nr:PAS and ANTAR domain-containing protein [Nocardioides sp.]THJ14735.1 ANTAR domain-containing protein [Nocardioides sp.]
MQAPLPSRPTGRFSFDAATGKWDWDDEVFRIHGYAPGAVVPTTDLVMGAKHPDDRERVLADLKRASHTGDPFAISYRILGADDTERRVVLVGEGGVCAPGESTLVQGYYIDLSADVEQIVGHEIHDAVEATVEARGTIEQAKGAIMLAYGLDADAAFAMLRWWSRNRNVKVRELAARLVGVVQEGGIGFADLRLRVDGLLHDLTEAPPNG